MQAPLKEKNDIKIFILYLMMNIGYPLDFSNLNDIVVQDGVVGYFDFAECFAELIDTGNILEIKEEDGEVYYKISEQGIHVAENLQSNLMMMIRERSVKSAFRLLSFKKRGSIIKSSSEPVPGGGYKFNCRIAENNQQLLNIDIFLDNKSQLDRMEHNFNEKPEIVYRGIFALLSGEVNYLIDN